MSDELRRLAEERLAEDAAGTPVDVADLQRLVHELRVHQIELELQNEELRLLKDAAEAANRAKAEFLANISHEIRTPLNAICGFGHALRATASPDQAARIDRIAQASQNLLAILDDILDLAKIESGRLRLDEKAFDPPRDVLEAVRSVVAQAAAGKGLRLEVETAGLPPRVVGDPARLRQALLNYAGNAVKFTEHGFVILRGLVDREEAATVWLRFEVRDTGIGIDAATQARLFRPFEQGDASATRRYGGTGLGLDLVRRLAGLMGGSVGVDSAPGTGSLFWFTARLGKPGAGGP